MNNYTDKKFNKRLTYKQITYIIIKFILKMCNNISN